MTWGQLGTHVGKNNIEPYLLLYTRMSSKWVIDPNIRAEMIKLWKESVGENLWLWVKERFLSKQRR